MQHSDQPNIELNKAKAAIQEMRSAKSLDAFEEAWKEYLGRLERVWNKSCAHFSKSPKWDGWKGRFEGLRKSDPLLSYLVNARGADEHSVNEITSREAPGMAINAASGNSLFIESMSISDGHLSIASPQALRFDFRPARTSLLPITNRGRVYPVPTEHQGKPTNPNDVVNLAETGILFYEDFLAKATAFFVK